MSHIFIYLIVCTSTLSCGHLCDIICRTKIFVKIDCHALLVQCVNTLFTLHLFQKSDLYLGSVYFVVKTRLGTVTKESDKRPKKLYQTTLPTKRPKGSKPPSKLLYE